MALGGIAGWGLGSAITSWGYRPYVNPYAVVASQPIIIQQPVVIQQVETPPQVIEVPAVHDYSQPLQAAAPPIADAQAEPSAGVDDPALQTFESAREAFKAEDYVGALQKTDETLKALPEDAAVHEFRALCLFALKQYDQSAGVLYAVLTAGPGWDWTTLISLYPNVGVYTEQLRALEAHRNAEPASSATRFVLAYHYLTAGFTDEAVREFQEVVRLEPEDALSRQIVASLTGAAEDTAPAPAAEAGPEHSLTGTWKASPDSSTSIELTIREDGGFTWNVTQQGRAQPITGTFTYGEGVLTLVRAGAEDDAMVGRVAWKDESEFVFQALGGGVGDPGLTFRK